MAAWAAAALAGACVPPAGPTPVRRDPVVIVAGTYEPPRKFVDDLPRNVNEAIRRLLEVKREDRMASAAELYELLYDKDEPNVGRLAISRRPTGPLLASSPHHEITIPPDEPVSSPAPLSISATAPTGIPAARRAQVPTGLRDQRPPTALVTQDSDPRPLTRTHLLIPALLAVVVVLGVSVVGLYFLLPAPKVEQGLAPQLPPVGTQQLPPPADPSVAGHGSVAVSGDAREVWLVSAAGRFAPGDAVQVGRYEILADFGGSEPVGAGRLELRSGDAVTVSCSRELGTCRVE